MSGLVREKGNIRLYFEEERDKALLAGGGKKKKGVFSSGDQNG